MQSKNQQIVTICSSSTIEEKCFMDSNKSLFDAYHHEGEREIPCGELSGEEGEGHGDHRKHGKSSIFMGAINIVNTIIGAGVLDLPYLMRQFGILVGGLIIILSCFLTYISCVLLLKVKNLSKHSKFCTIGVACFGTFGEKIIKLIILINNFGLCLVYLIIFGEVSSQLAAIISNNSHEFYYKSWFLIMVISFFMSPFIFTKSMNSLKGLSFISVLAIFIFSIITVYNFIIMVINNKYNDSDINFFPSSQLSFTNALASMPSVILAFTFQFNFFPVYKSLSKPTDKNMRTTTSLGLIIALIFYLTIAIAGYMTFGSTTSDEGLLKNFSARDLGIVLYILVQIAFSISSTLTFPLMFFGARENLYSFVINIIKTIYPNISNNNPLNPEINSEESNLLGSSRPKPTKSAKMIYIIYTILLYLFMIFLAIVTPSITTIFDFVGSTAANAISYLLPAAFFVTLCKSAGKWKCIGILLLIYGISVGIICLAASVISLINRQQYQQ